MGKLELQKMVFLSLDPKTRSTSSINVSEVNKSFRLADQVSAETPYKYAEINSEFASK